MTPDEEKRCRAISDAVAKYIQRLPLIVELRARDKLIETIESDIKFWNELLDYALKNKL